MTARVNTRTDVSGGLQRRLLWVLSTATFLIFFQAFMVAPLIPRLSDDLGVSPQRIGLVVPAYMIAYGIVDPRLRRRFRPVGPTPADGRLTRRVRRP